MPSATKDQFAAITLSGWRQFAEIGHNTAGDIEHKVPSSKAPQLHFSWTNLTCACSECNRRKRDYYVLGEEFIDPYADDVEDLVRHFGPLPSWKPGHARAETSLKILESGHPDRMPLVLRKIEKINQFDDLAERYLAENNPVLKAVLLKQLQHMRTLDSEYSAMLVEVGKQKGLPP